MNMTGKLVATEKDEVKVFNFPASVITWTYPNAYFLGKFSSDLYIEGDRISWKNMELGENVRWKRSAG